VTTNCVEAMAGDESSNGGDGNGGVVLFDALGLLNVNLVRAHKVRTKLCA
jgi:hypothetical protein